MLLIWLFSSFLFTREVGVLLVSSSTTFEYICQHLKEKDLRLTISYAGKTPLLCSMMDVEEVNYIRFPLGLAFSKGEKDVFRRSFDLPLNKELLECIYSRYISSDSKGGIFLEYASFIPAMVELIPLSVSWIVGGIVEDRQSSLYTVGDKRIVDFELLRTTYQFFNSSSSLFILDERVFKGDIAEFLESLLLKDMKVSKVSDVIDSLSVSSYPFSFNAYLDAIMDDEKNFLSYINKVGYSIFRVKGSLDEISSYLCDLTSYYPPSKKIDEFYEEVRRLSFELYSVSLVDPPSFIYGDFLKDNVNSISIEKTTSSLRYISDYGSFNVSFNQENLYFTVEFSTPTPYDEIHIYADINRRVGQGSNLAISKKIKIDDRSAWEYAFVISNNTLTLYTAPGRDYKSSREFKISEKANKTIFSLPLKIFSGNPLSWSYIVVVFKGDDISGFFRRINESIIASVDD